MNFFKTHSLPLFLISASLVLALLGDNSALALRYERSGVAEGEMWRLFSGHLIHMGWGHLWLNLAGLTVIWLLFSRFISTSLWWMATLLCSTGISLCLFLFMSDLQWYVGLSGLLHSLLVIGAVAGVGHGKKEFILLLIFVCTKVTWEQLYGPLTSDIAAPEGGVIVNAHLYGVVMGFVFALVFRVFIVVKSKWTGQRTG